MSSLLADVRSQRHVTSGLCRRRFFDDEVGETGDGGVEGGSGRVGQDRGEADVDPLTGVDDDRPRAASGPHADTTLPLQRPCRRRRQAAVKRGNRHRWRPVQVTAWTTVEPDMTTGWTRRLP